MIRLWLTIENKNSHSQLLKLFLSVTQVYCVLLFLSFEYGSHVYEETESTNEFHDDDRQRGRFLGPFSSSQLVFGLIVTVTAVQHCFAVYLHFIHNLINIDVQSHDVQKAENLTCTFTVSDRSPKLAVIANPQPAHQLPSFSFQIRDSVQKMYSRQQL